MPTTTPTIWSGPQTYRAVDDTKGAQIAALADGGFALLAAVNGDQYGDDCTAMFGQYYGGAGATVGGNFMAAFAGAEFTDVDVVQTEGGWLAWTFQRYFMNDANVLIGRINGPGDTQSTTFADVSEGGEYPHGIFAGPGGGAVALWRGAEGNYEFGRFDDDLVLDNGATGTPLPVPMTGVYNDLEEVGAQFANGSFAAAFGATGSQWVDVGFYDPRGKFLGYLRFNEPSPSIADGFSLKPTAGGDMLVSYNAAGVFYYSMVSSTGDFVVEERSLLLKNVASFDAPTTLLDDGGFLVAWTSVEGFGTASQSTAIRVQRFDAEGRLVGKNLVLDQPGDQQLTDVETLADGRVLMTFESETGATTDSFVHRFQIIDPRDARIEGDEGANGLYARLGDSELFGFEGADTLTGMDGDDALDGGAGADKLFGGVGDDLLEGGSGGDGLDGQTGDDTLLGGSGNDVMTGGAGADEMRGGGGSDIYRVDDAGDEVIERRNGGPVDRVESTITYTLANNVENLSLTGTAAIAGSGNALDNVITGNAAANLIRGDLGNDTLDGGLGNDTFRFDTALGSGNVDTIQGYVSANDVIQLENAVFIGLAVGALAPGAFATSAATPQADDRIIYNATTGALLFDRDGSGTTYAAVQFATVTGNPAGFGAGEFVVI